MPKMFIKPVANVIKPVFSFATYVCHYKYIKINNFLDAWKTARISPMSKISQSMELKDY